MNSIIRAAAIQATPVFLDKRKAIERYASLIEAAGREGAQLIVTRETGIAAPSPERLEELAKKYGMRKELLYALVDDITAN